MRAPTLILAATATLAVSLAACGGGATPAPTASSETPPAASSPSTAKTTDRAAVAACSAFDAAMTVPAEIATAAVAGEDQVPALTATRLDVAQGQADAAAALAAGDLQHGIELAGQAVHRLAQAYRLPDSSGTVTVGTQLGELGQAVDVVSGLCTAAGAPAVVHTVPTPAN